MIRCIAALMAVTTLTAGAQEIRPETIRAHMNFLASDLLEGRGAGTRGHDIAAAYVVAQFEAAGVEPGANGSYLQTVPFRKTIPDERSSITLIPDRGNPILLKFGDAFVTRGDALQEDRTVEGRVAVAGYGITAPELNHDDYAGIDVRDKIVVVFNGAPSRFAGPIRAHYSSTTGKIENAVEHGAAGMIMINTRGEAQRSPWDRTVRQSRLGAMHWIDGDGVPHDVSPRISSITTFNPAAIDQLFGGGQSLSELAKALKDDTLPSRDLPVRAVIRTISAHSRVDSPNVVGLVRGSDERLRDEYLVYSSHLDHLGISAPVGGDSINNGAFDNASGIAALIEIARAMAARKPAPRRSMLFLATTAEEKGLRGADYFAINPTVPPNQVVANINVDMILMTDPVRDVVVHGIDASSLGDAARAVSAETGIEISDEEAENIRTVGDAVRFINGLLDAIRRTLQRE